MRCFGDFRNDRVCDICKISNGKEHKKCKNKCNNKAKLFYIKLNCPHRIEKYDDDFNLFHCCNKNNNGYADDCKVTLNCEKYLL